MYKQVQHVQTGTNMYKRMLSAYQTVLVHILELLWLEVPSNRSRWSPDQQQQQQPQQQKS